MEPSDPKPRRIEDGFFLALLLIISAAFALIIEPFFLAILWGVIAAILFQPVYHMILRSMPEWRSTAAGLTLLLIISVVIVPALLLTVALIQEASVFYARFQSGEISFAMLFGQLRAAMPEWSEAWLERFGLNDWGGAQERLREGVTSSLQIIAGHAVTIGQGAFSMLIALSVMLYLTFFLLRDGEALAERVIQKTPLRAGPRRELLRQFVLVIRATVKGSIIVAVVQGLVGGVVFWLLGVEGALLWGVIMGFFSLLPAVGTGFVWVPVAIYLFATGAVVEAFILVFCGIFVIGLIDNLLRPILVGRDTRMPDYLVLITTLGGLQLFGFSGLVIGPVIAALFIAIWNIVAGMRGADEGQLPVTDPIDAPEANAPPPAQREKAAAGRAPRQTRKRAERPQGG